MKKILMPILMLFSLASCQTEKLVSPDYLDGTLWVHHNQDSENVIWGVNYSFLYFIDGHMSYLYKHKESGDIYKKQTYTYRVENGEVFIKAMNEGKAIENSLGVIYGATLVYSQDRYYLSHKSLADYSYSE